MNETSRLDERAVSWKVVLPCRSGSRICAVGLDEGSVAGLARSYKEVDTEPVNGTKYDTVVLGSCGRKRVADLICRVKKDGIIVDAGREDNSVHLIDEGFKHSRRYAALPPEKTRLFVPLVSKRLRSKALTFHVPASLKAHIGLTLARGLSSLGIEQHLTKRTVSLHARHEGILDKGGLIEWISSKLGYSILDLVVHTGSESPRRKMTALAIAGQQGKDVLVRIADTELGADAIRQESRALRAIGASDLSGQVPEMIAEGRWNNYFVQLQEGMSYPAKRQITHLTGSHLVFLSRLSRMDRKLMYFNKTWIWNRLRTWAETNRLADVPCSVRNLLHAILSGDLAGKLVVCHRTHGDFAPWNIKACDGRLFVLDWEDSLPDGLALTDAFHFLYRQASLVGPWPGAIQMVRRMHRAVAALCRPEGPQIAERKTYLQIWMLHEYMHYASDRIVEMCDQLHSGIPND